MATADTSAMELRASEFRSAYARVKSEIAKVIAVRKYPIAPRSGAPASRSGLLRHSGVNRKANISCRSHTICEPPCTPLAADVLQTISM